MTRSNWLSLSEGTVDLLCSGSEDQVTTFLNQAVQAHLQLENIEWVSTNDIKCTIRLRDFYNIIKLIRKNHLRMKILRKRGLPFWMLHIKSKKFFYIGILVFIFLLFSLSSFIWKIDIKGAEHVPEGMVRSLLRQEGIYVGQIKYRIPDPDRIKQRLLSKLPESAWVGIQLEGTRVIITLVEKKQVEKKKDDVPSYGPVHLIAKKDALITDMQVEKGNPVVGIHDVVEKGELLVSGIYGDLEQGSSGKVIGAKGKVIGEAWYEVQVEIPTSQHRNVFTGETENRIHPYIGSWILTIPMFEPKFHSYKILDKPRSLYIGRWKLPFGWIEREYLKMKKTRYQLTFSEARKLGMSRAKEELQQSLGGDGKILMEKVLHQRAENGKVYLKIHFDVTENIAVPKPIIQGE